MSSYSGEIILWVDITAESKPEAYEKLKVVAVQVTDLLGVSGTDYLEPVTAGRIVLEEG